MKKVISLCLIICIIVSFCSCTIGVSNIQLTVGTLDEIVTLDPLYADGDGEKIIAANCFEGLLRYDEEGNIDLAGATAYTTGKGAFSYTFKLNPSAKWYIPKNVKTTLDSVGITDFREEITAADYIYGIKRFFRMGRTELSSIKGYAEFMADNKTAQLGLKAIDDYTLEITLAKADPDFLYKLATMPVYPCREEFCDALEGIFYTTPATALCNGPYYIKEVSQTQSVIEKNPEYNGNIQVKNKSIVLYATGQKSALISRFADGSYDVFVATNMEKPEDFTPSYSSVNGTWGFAFNCNSEMGKLPELRNILLSSIDYDKIKLPDFATLKADRIIPDNFTVFNKAYSSFNPQKSGYKVNKETAQKNIDTLLNKLSKESLTIKFSIPAELEKSMETVISTWQTLFEDKIIFDVKVFETAYMDEIVSDSDYDLAILPLKPLRRTASGVIEAISGAHCYYSDKKIATLAKQAISDEKTASANYSKIEKLIVDSGVFVPLFFATNDLYENEDVSGIYTADGGNLIYFHGGEIIEE